MTTATAQQPEPYQERVTLTASRVVELAEQWRKACGMGPVLQGERGREFRALGQPAFRTMGSSIFIEDMIRETIAQTRLYEYPNLRFSSGELIPIIRGGHRGLDDFSWNEMDRTGNDAPSGLVSDDSNNIRSVTVVGKGYTAKVMTHMRSFDYTGLDQDRAELQGAFNIVQAKSQAVRSQMEWDHNEYIATGVPGANMPSFYALPGAYLNYASPVGTWSGATNAQIESDVAAAVDAQLVAINDINGLQADTAIFGRALWKIMKRSYGVEGSKTLLQQLKDANPEIKVWTFEEHAPAGSLTLYKNDPLYVQARKIVDMEFLPPEATAARFRVICRSRITGAISMQPRTMLQMTGL